MANEGRAGEGAGVNSYPGNGANPNTQNSNMMIQGQVREGQGVYNVIVAGNAGAYPGNSAYPNINVNVAGNRTYPNIQNSNMMIQGQGQDQHQGRGPYGYNQALYPQSYEHNQAWYPSNYTYPNSPPAMYMNLDMNGYNGGYYFNEYNQAWYPGAPSNYTYPNPPPATYMHMNMNGYNDGYYFNEYDGYYYFYHPPTNGFYPLQPQPQFQVQPQPVFDAGRRRRGSSSSRHSGGRNSNTLRETGRGRGRGRVFRDNNYNNNTSLPQVMGNIGEQLMGMRINEGERSTQLQGQGRVEPDEHANAAVVHRDYSNPKFFVIKSYSRENVVSSIKHAVWTSTRRGNRILNAAFKEPRAIFLFFSVERSGNFCGVAEMDGPVDFEASADCWDRDWKGKFPVKWRTIKDVPYSQFQHITFNTVGNPSHISIIYGRDTQQVEFEKGMEMLDIFDKYVSTASLMDDASKSTASPKQQQSQPPSPPRQQQEEQPEGKEKEKETEGKNGCELYCTGTGSASCDINTNQIKLEDSPNHMQLQEILNTDETTHLTTQEIVNADHETSELINIMVDTTNCDTDEAQQTHLDNCMKPPAKTTVDKEETHQYHVETSYEPGELSVDTDATTQVNEDNTGDTDTNQNKTPVP